jgi:anti-sigma factor RsiW
MYDTQFRALAASNVLMWLAIGFGALPWWLGASDPLDWIVAAGMSAALVSVSLILSGCVTRFGEATENAHYLTAGLTIALGLVLIGIEAGMTHQGLAWLDARKDLAPDWALWIVSFGLSAFNVFSLYTFARDMKKKPVTNPARMLAELRWKDKKAA